MKKLNYLLWQELCQTKKEIFIIGALIFLGISVFIAYYLAYQNLSEAINHYGEQYHLFDYYVESRDIPDEAVAKIKALNGVNSIVGRISSNVSGEFPKGKRVSLQILSLPERGLPVINKVQFVAGQAENDTNVCWVEQKVAVKYGLKVGDFLKILVNLKEYRFRIAAIVISPEFLVPNKASSLNSDFEQNTEVIYLRESVVRSFANQKNYNQLVIKFDSYVNQLTLIKRIERIIKPYSLVRGVTRLKQLNYQVLNEELRNYLKIAWFFGLVLLSLTGIMVNWAQKLKFQRQRNELLLLQIYGYEQRKLFWHYLKYVFLIGIFAISPAFLYGSYWGMIICKDYQVRFSSPIVDFHYFGSTFLYAIGLTFGFLLISTYPVISKYVQQKNNNSWYKANYQKPQILLDRYLWFWDKISFELRIVLRSIVYYWSRTAWFFWSSTLVIAVIIFSVLLFKNLNLGLNHYYNNIEQYDLKVVFNRPVSYYDALELQRIKGIYKIEPILQIKVNLKKEWRTKEICLRGLPEGASLIGLTNQALLPIKISTTGIILSEAVAKKMEVKVGENIFVKPYLESISERPIKVIGITKEYLHFNCYMEIKTLGQFLGEGSFANAVLLKVTSRKLESVKRELYKYPVILELVERQVAFKAEQAHYLIIYLFIGVLCLGVVAGYFIVIYYSNKMIFNERQSDLRLLNLLGCAETKIFKLLYFENLILLTVSLFPGILLGHTINYLFVKIFFDPVFAGEIVFYPGIYLMAFLISWGILFLAQRVKFGELFNTE